MLTRRALVALAFVSVCASEGFAQDEEKKLGWELEGSVSGVWTAGNSESNTYGADAKLRRLWSKSTLTLRGGGTQTQSTKVTRTATGTQESFEIQKFEDTEKTAELFYARGLFEYNISTKFFAFGGVDWLRNTFAGFDSRFLTALGAGNTWADSEKTRFKTFYSATYTFQEDVVENPFTNANFPGVRFGYDFWFAVSSTTEFTSVFVLDLNLDNTEDVRFDLTNGLPVKISEVFYLKPSWQLLWRNEPSLTSVPVVDAGGVPTGATVLAPLEELDSIFSLSLLVKL